MKTEYDLNAYVEKVRNGPSYFRTFINRSSLAAGVLILRPGEKDTKLPHDSDEVYYVVSGDGYLKIRNRDHRVSKDRLFFVPKGVEHFFHGNTREIRVLYFFGGPDP